MLCKWCGKVHGEEDQMLWFGDFKLVLCDGVPKGEFVFSDDDD